MQDDLIHIDPTLLAKYNRAVPRYTSYPTAPQFHEIYESEYVEKLKSFDQTKKPLSLYLHIPFCKTMCLFCGCSVVLNRKPERQTLYFDSLLQEIEQVSSYFSQKREVLQLHLGGGTPTSLTHEQFECLIKKLHHHFKIPQNAEISIEIDPRTVVQDQGSKLRLLKKLGFNRVSFGVQDLDPIVQEAVKRRQSEEMTIQTYELARELRFDGINIDLIYGLPFQTVQSFQKTIDRIVEMGPDRIALYSYAKVPWLKPHQKAIDEKSLPSTKEKFQIYVDARAKLMQGGYMAIGMDHFALKKDSMAKAYVERKLIRNFQGYSVHFAEDLIGFGMSSIGFLENSYFQNAKELFLYQTKVEEKRLPIVRGFHLSKEDQSRRKLIFQLMCHFELLKEQVPDISFQKSIEEGLLIEEAKRFVVTPLGRVLIRLVAAELDTYLSKGKFSKAI